MVIVRERYYAQAAMIKAWGREHQLIALKGVTVCFPFINF